MRPAHSLASLFAIAALGIAAAGAAAQDKPAAKPAPAKAAVPADVRARVVAKLPGAKAEDVALSPIPGLYEVTMGGLIAYVSNECKYLLSRHV